MKRKHGKTGRKILLGIGFFLVAGVFAARVSAETGDGETVSIAGRLKQFNLGEGAVALDGYDPVSYFKGRPRKGKRGIRSRYRGINYQFASEDNRKAFAEDPEKYEPAYGGWCAWAMEEGEKYAVDPENFKIIKGRNYLFYKGWTSDTLKKWNNKAEKEGEENLLRKANRHWKVFLAKP